mgnify:CR=1 FL=1
MLYLCFVKMGVAMCEVVSRFAPSRQQRLLSVNEIQTY